MIYGHRLGGPARGGEILEVSGEDGVPPYLVRWKDGHVSRRYPSSDSRVQHFEHERSR